MTDDIISLSVSVPAIRAIVGASPEDFGLLVTLAQAGKIPVTKTKACGYLMSRRDLPLITAIFKDYRSK
jgi:hypothetical protein